MPFPCQGSSFITSPVRTGLGSAAVLSAGDHHFEVHNIMQDFDLKVTAWNHFDGSVPCNRMNCNFSEMVGSQPYIHVHPNIQVFNTWHSHDITSFACSLHLHYIWQIIREQGFLFMSVALRNSGGRQITQKGRHLHNAALMPPSFFPNLFCCDFFHKLTSVITIFIITYHAFISFIWVGWITLKTFSSKF